MANDKKTQSEDLKKLEDEAYFELCQIIAEAMQYQDVELLNSRISAWKNKYKKLLDDSPSNSNFKKRVEFLLTQYYSSVTQYILGQLKLKEEKKIENQSRALKKLYSIIKETNDLDLLKKKVNEWKEKYPVSGFIKMYQKRIELYTREKNLKENAFEQEKAFKDLVDITKIHGSLDELKYKLNLWEEKYSINNKYTIDDFIKHQTEVKRFTSDEFLQSIAREDFNDINKNDIDFVEQYNNKCSSSLSVQAVAYSTLLTIASKSNNTNELFDWVYKNRYVQFNDKYKELILNATYLNYRPEYLKSLAIPNMNILKNSLSFDEYLNITEIKKYAILSYFNLLLPPDKAMQNNYFTKYVQTIYSKSEEAKNNDSINSETEFSFKDSDKDIATTISKNDLESDTSSTSKDIKSSEIKNINDSEIIIDLPNDESKDIVINDIDTEENIEKIDSPLDILDNESNLVTDLNKCNNSEDISFNITESTEHQESNISLTFENDKDQIETDNIIVDENESINQPDYDTIVAISPLFFETINNYNKQSVLINSIDSIVDEYVEKEPTKNITLEEDVKSRNDLD